MAALNNPNFFLSFFFSFFRLEFYRQTFKRDIYFLLVTRKLLSGSVRVVFVVRVLLMRSIQCANMAAG